MDIFMEKLVTRKKGFKDQLITIGIILGALILIMLSLSIKVIAELGIGPFLILGLGYLAFRLVSSKNVEYEYIVTNGELDIDKIIAKRKRKRIFSASCKEFDILSRVKSDDFNHSVQSITNKIDASSSMDSPDAFFATLNYKGQKTLVIFEPDERMLNNFKFFIPRKVFLNKENLQ